MHNAYDIKITVLKFNVINKPILYYHTCIINKKKNKSIIDV